MVDGHISAQKAERIYDEEQVLRGIRDHITGLEIEQSMDEVQGTPRNGDLESRLSAAYARRDEKEAEIEQMKAEYQDWLRDNA